jgi:hypothetical protein
MGYNLQKDTGFKKKQIKNQAPRPTMINVTSLFIAYIVMAPFSLGASALLYDLDMEPQSKKELIMLICYCIGWPILLPVGLIKRIIDYWKSLPGDTNNVEIGDSSDVKSFELDKMRFKDEKYYTDFSIMIKQSKENK